MKILIVGGTGVLSSAVTSEALRQGIEVTMINRGNRPIPDGVEHIKADRNDLKTIAHHLEGRYFDAVMDYLCFTDEQTEKSVRFYSKYTRQYFYISSCAVYDTESLNGKMADEESKKGLPIWKYSVDKWASEQKLQALLNGTDVKFTIIRPCVTYGDTRIPYGIMPPYGYHWTLCARILAGKPIITWNGGQNRCNMTRVEDFAVGVVGLIGNIKAYNESFNVCGDETPSFKEVLDIVGELLNKEVITVDITPEFYAKEIPDKAGEIIGGRAIDTMNINKKLKDVVPEFTQRVTLKDGISRTIKAYRSHNYQQGIDWRYDGDTDRIIKKWIVKNKTEQGPFIIGFVDYLGNATNKDRINYWVEYHKDNLFIKLFLFLNRVVVKIICLIGR